MAKAHKIVEGLKEAVKLNGWLPIASYTHRKAGGYSVLLYDREWEMTEGAIQIGWPDDDGGWRVSHMSDFSPTHWRPLPEPPVLPDLPEDEEDESVSQVHD